METFTFSRTKYGALTASAETKRAIGEEFARSPGLMPPSIVCAAADDLVAKSKDMMFSTGKDYESCSKRAMELDPWLRIATAVKGAESSAAGMGIVIMEAGNA